MNAMNKKRGLAGMVAVLFLGLAVLLLFACSDEMEVQQSYPFKVGYLLSYSVVRQKLLRLVCCL